MRSVICQTTQDSCKLAILQRLAVLKMRILWVGVWLLTLGSHIFEYSFVSCGTAQIKVNSETAFKSVHSYGLRKLLRLVAQVVH